MTLTMTELIAKNINDPTLKDWAMPSFTTTTYTDRIVGAVCLMATMKKLEVNSKDKVQRLNEFDLQEKLMSKWTTMLNPIIDQFIASVEGKADTEWWNRIANHVGGGSGPTWLSGWITVFSCFAEDGEWRGDDKEKHGFRTKGELVSEWPLIDTEEIAHGYVVLDVKIDDNGTMYDAQLFGGHYTVKLADEKSTIVPQLNWCMMVKESDLPALKKN
ncbi:hypothetical protein PPL_00203 [Heterostelium album PN500]|uniref:Uncharacterized protein n=1 Tax=Heterostelium pallidum (strain ATCC 26659 / Pp 5 / PN500) TaxID=670386 RepID=D3AVT8_HETP5|nr:hypothetical protein PPL_00203 [Heterostelium album PN500]EFA86411.1 hypothetical protein PPL_00203 [Heterostelium album PN500]|eukprot:XP_020438516.1 hypothetical protein PPL_00203 [Heterostelium album PN500]